MCSIKAILSNWAESTTCHGIPDVHKSRSCCGKIMWLLLTFVFLLLMSIQLYSVHISFAEHKWMTTVYEDTLTAMDDFPTITICSYNRLQQSKRMAKGLTDEHLIYAFSAFPVSQLVRSEFLNVGNFESNDGREQFLKWKQIHNMTTKQIFQTMGYACADMIDYVRRADFITDDCVPTPNANFTPVFTPEFGQCHQIATTLTNKIVYAGKIEGLTVVLKANLDEYLNFTENNYMDEGFAVQLQFGSRVIVGQWITVAPGFHYTLAMKERRTQTRLSTSILGLKFRQLQKLFSMYIPEPPCEQNPKLKYDVDENYSRQQCLAECSLDYFYKYCHCLPFFDSPYVRMCEVEELTECYRLLQEYNLTTPIESCTIACKERCSDRIVETSVTFGRFPPRNQLKNIQKLLTFRNESITLEQVREDYLMLDIFYEKLSITVVELYESQVLEDYISSLGGVMSLWAGMSIFTIVQAIVYLLHAFFCGLCPASREKKFRKVQPAPQAPLPALRNRSHLSQSTSDA